MEINYNEICKEYTKRLDLIAKGLYSSPKPSLPELIDYMNEGLYLTSELIELYFNAYYDEQILPLLNVIYNSLIIWTTILISSLSIYTRPLCLIAYYKMYKIIKDIRNRNTSNENTNLIHELQQRLTNYASTISNMVGKYDSNEYSDDTDDFLYANCLLSNYLEGVINLNDSQKALVYSLLQEYFNDKSLSFDELIEICLDMEYETSLLLKTVIKSNNKEFIKEVFIRRIRKKQNK